MMTKAFQCTYCGLRGEIALNGLNEGDNGARVFRHVGHNPYSGHLHYQCPACEIVLLVHPLDILGYKVMADDVLHVIPQAS